MLKVNSDSDKAQQARGDHTWRSICSRIYFPNLFINERSICVKGIQESFDTAGAHMYYVLTMGGVNFAMQKEAVTRPTPNQHNEEPRR